MSGLSMSSASSHVDAPWITLCFLSLVDSLRGFGGRSPLFGIAHTVWYPAYAVNQLFRLAGGGARHGNVTTSYTVLYLSASVPGRGGLAVFLGRALSCPFWERCRILMAVEGRGLGLPGASHASLLWSLSPLSPFGKFFSSLARLLCALSLASGFLVPAGEMYLPPMGEMAPAGRFLSHGVSWGRCPLALTAPSSF